MIRQISEDLVDIINPLLPKMRARIGEDALPPNFEESVKKSIAEGKSTLYGVFNEDDNLLGFGLWRNIAKGISFVFADDFKLENDLISTILNNHSKECSAVMAAGPWVTKSISDHLINIGFRKLDRAYMTLPRKTIENMDSINLPSGMSFEIYEEKQRDAVSSVMFKGNDGHIDQIVFPNFFSNIEKCKELLKNIENSVYGEYKRPYSWVLKKEDSIIGACFLTIREKGESGYIPDIVVDPDFQGQKLGKAMLVYSMKKLLEGEPDVGQVSLDVTLENNARFLYQSLGFKFVQEYSMYTWTCK